MKVERPASGEQSSKEILALADALRPALLRVSRALRRETQRAGVSAVDAQILGIVKKHPGIGVSELAEREQVSAASMSIHVKRLVEAGWIERNADPHQDRRRAGLKLSPIGVRAMEAIRRRRNDWLAARIARLDPEARAALADAVESLTRLTEDRS